MKNEMKMNRSIFRYKRELIDEYKNIKKGRITKIKMLKMCRNSKLIILVSAAMISSICLVRNITFAEDTRNDKASLFIDNLDQEQDEVDERGGEGAAKFRSELISDTNKRTSEELNWRQMLEVGSNSNNLKQVNKRHSAGFGHPLSETSGISTQQRIKHQFGSSAQQRRRQQQLEEPPNELIFSNETGAIAQCGVAIELARSIAKAEAKQTTTSTSGPQFESTSAIRSSPSSLLSSSPSSNDQLGHLGGASSLKSALDIQVRWERSETGEELEQVIYGTNNSTGQALDNNISETSSYNFNLNNNKQRPPLRFIRNSDKALVFEPFKAQDFRPDIHATTYRCVASSQSRGASIVSRDMRVKATPPAATFTNQAQLISAGQATTLNSGGSSHSFIQLEVLDELVVEGMSALLKCLIPSYAQEYLQVVDWIEYPSETLLSFQSTTLANANHLFIHPTVALRRQQQHIVHRRQQQQLLQSPELLINKTSSGSGSSRYFVSPKSGDLHIINVDISFNNRYYKCRCKNKLTGELITSANKGKLIVSESHSLVAPRIIAETSPLSSAQAAYLEGELAMLSCNVQAFSRAQISWFKQINELQSKPIETDNYKYVQLATLLLINNVNRNDSGIYLCSVKNPIGEERSEIELQVRDPLKAKLYASSNVLELGKSLALECSVTGYPIHQVVFRHNQNVIKSISGSVGPSGGTSMSQQHNNFIGGQQQQQQHQHQQLNLATAGFPSSAPYTTTNSKRRDYHHHHHSDPSNYFVVDESSGTLSSAKASIVDKQQLLLTKQAGGMITGTRVEEEEDDDDDDISKGGDAPPFDSTNNDANSNSTIPRGTASEEASDDMNSSSGDDYETANQIKLSHVIVIVLEPQHAGSYQCFAYNQYESVQSSAYIRVLDDPPKFKDTFKSEVFEQHQDISLQCSARANPLPEITWSIDEQPIPESSRTRFGDFVTKENLVISYVNISQTQVVDSGLYRCTADNGLAQISHQAQINILGTVQVKPMENVTVLASTSFKIRCPVAGFPVTDIQWQHNGRRLPTNHRQHVFENGTLEVEHMEKSQGDEGEYTCIVRGPTLDMSGGGGGGGGGSGRNPEPLQAQQLKTAYGSVFVSIKVKPTIEPFTISRSLREGQRASVMCTISSGDLPISISWFRNDRPLLESTSSSSTGTGLLTDSSEQLLTLGAPITPQVALNWQQHQQQLQIESNNSLNNNAYLLSGVRISRVSDYSSTLLFESLLAQHSANYTCLARNQAGQVSHQAPMIVQVAPKWSIEPVDANVVRGSSASIDCMASGFPPPRIIWTKAAPSPDLAGVSSSSPLLTSFSSQQALSGSSSSYSSSLSSSINKDSNKDGVAAVGSTLIRSHHLGSWRSIVSSPHLQVHENGSLNILDARDSDLGHYMCQASNGVGPGLSKVIKVTINVAAQFNSRHSIQYVVKGEPTHLKCQAKGDWPLVIHWFKNKDHLEPINVRDSTTTTTTTTQQQQQQLLGQQQSPTSQSSTNSLLVSSSIASILLVPNAGSATTFFHNLPAHNKPKNGSFLDQLNALISSSSANSFNAPSSSVTNLPEAKQHGVGIGATQLMQKYTLSTNELIPNSAASSDLLKQHSSANSNSNSDNNNNVLFAEFNNQIPGKSASLSSPLMLNQQQQPLVVQVNSVLSIAQTERQDTGTFKCFAANYYGYDERTIQLIIQEIPEKIEDFSVLEVNSRSITLGWLIPFDGNTPITNYHIQYKPITAATTMPNNFPSHTTTISTPTSSPSKLGTSSQMSPEALNALGWFNYTLPSSSTSSSTTNNNHDNNSSHNNQVVILHNSIFNQQQQQQQGLFDGNLARSQQLLASTTPPGGPRSLVRITISSLKAVTLYWFRVAPENKLGLGSFSNVIESRTLEEAPGAAPSKLKAVAQSSSTILVSWFRLNEKEVFGSVQGYYVAYKALPDSSQDNNNTTHPYRSSDSNQSGGEQQQQLQVGDVSYNNPVLNIYKTIQHDDKLNKFDALLTGLKRSTKYLISVQAFNARGTGPSTEPVLVKTLEMDPPKQVKLYVKQATNCSIQLEWRPMSQAALLQLHMLQNKPSSLSTSTNNKILTTATPKNNVVSILPLAMPLQASIGMDSQSLQKETTTASVVDVVDYYSLYQAELNDRPRWQEIRLPGHASSHTIENLRCGTRYQFYMMGINKIGVGDQSDILDTKTVGGLPLAPDRQSTFDVINTTCYIIRLDHWQNNGCQIREFNIRYKPDLSSVRDWTQLAHFNLVSSSEDLESGQSLDEDYRSGGENGAQLGTLIEQQQQQQQQQLQSNPKEPQTVGKNVPTGSSQSGQIDKRRFVDEDWISTATRLKRSTSTNTVIDSLEQQREQQESKSSPLEDVYLFTVDDNPSRSDYEDSFFDYFSDNDPAGFNLDPADYAQVDGSSSLNLSQQFDNGQNNKLFNLLKDSMIPTFDSSELMQSRLEHLSGADNKLPAIAQEWQSSNFVENKAYESANKANLQSNKKQDNSGNNLRTAHATKIASPNNPSTRTVGTSQQDWRRVRLCNLVENIYYTVQITALNLVGETEAELRLLTSQEGLEYDQDIKRQVVGKLGVDRIAQQSLSSISDRFNLFGSLNQWPGSILLPTTLMITLITILFIIALLLKRSNSAPGSTSTTTTTMSSSSDSSSHCQNYLDSESDHRHHHHHHHHHRTLSKNSPDRIDGFRASTLGGAESELDGPTRIDGYTLTNSAHNGILDHTFSNNHNSNVTTNMSIYQQRGSIDEPGYGSLVNRLINPAPGSSCIGDTNRSSSSPATTTAATTSMNSGSTGNNNSGHINHAIYLRSEALTSNANQDNITRGRSVYLCSNGAKDEALISSKNQDAPVFYGMASNIPAIGIYGTQQGSNAQVRHYQQQQPQETNQQQHMFEQQNHIAETDIYSGHVANASPQHETGNPDDKIDNCFLNIVEEVARANDNLQQQQQQQHRANTAQFIKSNTLNAATIHQHHQQQQQQLHQLDQTIGHQCNSIDCFNPHHFHIQPPPPLVQSNANNVSNYASPGEDICAKNDTINDNTNGQNGHSSNRLMFDPVYATIRRTFPQAFRYLTLQQHHLQHQHQHQNQQQQQQQQQINSNRPISPVNDANNDGRQSMFDQRNITDDNQRQMNHHSLMDNFANKRQQSFDSQIVQNIPLFNSNNLAALNLLTPSNPISTPFQSINTAIVQQPTNNNNAANNNNQQ